MTMNPLPPQAYTKDILLKAYQWLMGQDSSLKEIATTPDILVSLYLKATRDGEHALARPSIQNFKNELRSLAGMMGELDRPAAAVAAGPAILAPKTPATQQVQTTAPSANPAPAPAPAPIRTMPITEPLETAAPVTATASPQRADVFAQLDPQSLAMIQEVKEQFNLSSDLESLRMLIKVGYTRSKNLLS